MRKAWRCRFGWHAYADFPDPNTETRGLEQQGYRACLRCSKEHDRASWRPRTEQRWWTWSK